MLDIDELKAKHGDHLYVTEVRGAPYIWRPLTRPEWIRIRSTSPTQDERRELVCATAVVWPEGIDYRHHSPAGLTPLLAAEIEEASGVGSPGYAVALLERERSRMEGFEAQVEVVINTAFPHISFEDMAVWPFEKLLRYLARAEWQLKVIKGQPVELQLFDPTELPADSPEDEEETAERTVEDVVRDRTFGDPMLTQYTPPKTDTGLIKIPFISGTQAWRREGSVNGIGAGLPSREPAIPPVFGRS